MWPSEAAPQGFLLLPEGKGCGHAAALDPAPRLGVRVGGRQEAEATPAPHMPSIGILGVGAGVAEHLGL